MHMAEILSSVAWQPLPFRNICEGQRKQKRIPSSTAGYSARHSPSLRHAFTTRPLLQVWRLRTRHRWTQVPLLPPPFATIADCHDLCACASYSTVRDERIFAVLEPKLLKPSQPDVGPRPWSRNPWLSTSFNWGPRKCSGL